MTQQSSSPVRLSKGVLSTAEVATTTMANIGPAASVVLTFGAIFAVSGIGSPLTVLAAVVSIALLGNTIAQFARVRPSAGSFVTLIGKGLGPHAAVTTAVALQAGYILATAGVLAGTAGIFESFFLQYFHVDISWKIFALVLAVGITLVLLAGVKPSTKVAAASFGFEMLVLVVIAVIILIQHRDSLTLAPFNPGNLTGGFSGLGLAFPLAILAFVGWENSAGMAEETVNPRRAVGRAIMIGTVVVGITFIVLAYATSVAFDNDISKLSASKSGLPFVDAAGAISPVFECLAYIATLSSLVGCLIAAVNAEGRILFNSGREGLIPRWFGRTSKKNNTPTPVIITYLVMALALVFIFGWNIDPLTFFGEIATLGTILIVVVYAVSNIALPIFLHREGRKLSIPTHIVIPALAFVSLLYPLWALIQPGQAAPYSWFPWVALAIAVFGLVYSIFVVKKDATIGERIGAILADDDDQASRPAAVLEEPDPLASAS